MSSLPLVDGVEKSLAAQAADRLRASGANRNDSMLVEALLASMPAIKRGGRGHRPANRHGAQHLTRHEDHAVARTPHAGGLDP